MYSPREAVQERRHEFLTQRREAGAPVIHPAYAAEFGGGAAQRELLVLGRHEVVVHRVRQVDAQPALHVDRIQ